MAESINNKRPREEEDGSVGAAPVFQFSFFFFFLLVFVLLFADSKVCVCVCRSVEAAQQELAEYADKCRVFAEQLGAQAERAALLRAQVLREADKQAAQVALRLKQVTTKQNKTKKKKKKKKANFSFFLSHRLRTCAILFFARRTWMLFV